MTKGTCVFLLFTFHFSLFTFNSSAQLPSPLDAPLVISGAFGEPRDHHFHTGVDFTTRKKTGVKVFAVMDGYVSRIKVSPYGYGRALYVTHPNGTMSVYGHLEKFNDAIQQYVTDQQYAQHKNELELYPDKNKFRVKQGEVIAYSGNSGGSSAPHLHFEIRDASGESFPENPLAYKLPLKDTMPPAFRSLVIYDRAGLEEKELQTYPLKKLGTTYTINATSQPDTVNINTPMPAFGVSAVDFDNYNDDDFGIYKLTMSVDDKLSFEMKMNRLDFAEGRNADALVDYRKLKHDKEKFYRLYVLPGNAASVYTTTSEQSRLRFSDASLHKIQITAEDFFGNATVYQFFARNTSGQSAPVPAMPKRGTYEVFSQPFEIKTDSLKATFDANTFFDNTIITSNIAPRTNALSDDVMIGSDDIPLNKKFSLSMPLLETVDDRLLTKLMIENLSTRKFYKTESNNQWVTAHPIDLGEFVVMMDTSAPVVTPLFGLKHKAPLPLAFGIWDRVASVKDYDIYVDGRWQPTYYDAKNDKLECTPKPKPAAGLHKIRVIASDAVGNKKTYNYKIRF